LRDRRPGSGVLSPLCLSGRAIVIYKEAGKLYMVPGNEPGAQTFQDDFDIAY